MLMPPSTLCTCAAATLYQPPSHTSAHQRNDRALLRMAWRVSVPSGPRDHAVEFMPQSKLPGGGQAQGTRLSNDFRKSGRVSNLIHTLTADNAVRIRQVVYEEQEMPHLIARAKSGIERCVAGKLETWRDRVGRKLALAGSEIHDGTACRQS